MNNLFKQHGLSIALLIILIVAAMNTVAILTKAFDLATGISIYAVLISISILTISMNEIRNRLRPWVAVARIDQETTENPDIFYSHFIITNTGPIPATRILYTTRWYLQENGKWKELEILGESPFTSARHTLFPNQSIRHRTEMHDIIDETGDKDTKVTFLIEYRGLWSKHTTTNTHKFDNAHKVWVPDEPQDYT